MIAVMYGLEMSTEPGAIQTWCIARSKRTVRTNCGSATTPLFRLGRDLPTSPSSSTSTHGESSAGSCRRANRPNSCSMRSNRRFTRGVPATRWCITATADRNMCRFATPSAWPKPASSRLSEASETATTTRWPKRSMGCTRPRSCIVVPGAVAKSWNWPRCAGWIGTTPATTRIDRLHPTRRSRSELLSTATARHGDVTHANEPPGIPGRFRLTLHRVQGTAVKTGGPPRWEELPGVSCAQLPYESPTRGY